MLSWICCDIWLNILPFFDHAELGLKLALISPRFVALVDKHFDGTPELTTLWRRIIIRKNIGPKAKLSVLVDGKFVAFPFPADGPLRNRIRFKDLRFAELLRRTHGILIDEISMQHKDVLEFNTPFAGKVVILGGDWKQLAPVVPGGGHIDQLNASAFVSTTHQQQKRVRRTVKRASDYVLNIDKWSII
ncbi:hypothetical protein niasHS_008962 [Heterodera schachtii]|uniref:ATP-dependent DNA helicase n=1 Tax=Heterodera schachtii TaxID=97005 RepID=A0ABD2J5Z2_HETSC